MIETLRARLAGNKKPGSQVCGLPVRRDALSWAVPCCTCHVISHRAPCPLWSKILSTSADIFVVLGDRPHGSSRHGAAVYLFLSILAVVLGVRCRS